MYLVGNIGKQHATGTAVNWLGYLELGLDKIIEDLAQANYWWIGLSLIIALLSHFFRALRWNLLIEPLGYKPKSVTTFFAIMVMYLFNLIVPRMGEVTRCGVLYRYEKIPVTKLLGTMVIERAVDFICLLAVIAFTFLLQFNVIMGFLEESLSAKMQGEDHNVTALLAGLGVVFVAMMIVAIRFILPRLKRLTFFYKIKRLLAGLRAGFKSIRMMRNNKLFILHSLLVWIGYFLMIYVAFFSYDKTAGLSLLVALSVLAIGSLGMVAPVQGGIGAYHYCVQVTLLAYGLTAENGLSFAFIIHTAQILLIIIVGVISLFLLPVFAKRRNNDKSRGYPVQNL